MLFTLTRLSIFEKVGFFICEIAMSAMKMIKIVNYLADKIECKTKGEVLISHSIIEKNTLSMMIESRIDELENKSVSDSNYKKLSKSQELNFLKNMLIRLENE